MPTDYIIVEAGIDDVEAIVDVTMRSFEDAFNKPFYMEREAAVHRWKAYIRKEHHPRDAKDPRIIYVAIADGEIVGFIAGHLTERFDLKGELQSIYILLEHQRQGLGTQLVIALAKWFEKWNAKAVCVDHKRCTVSIVISQHRYFLYIGRRCFFRCNSHRAIARCTRKIS